MELRQKLEILADAAKYDASCASSGTAKRDSRDGGLGSTEGMGICHAYAPDGRCISLLKVLLTNACVYDCAYCINRATSNVQRARFTVRELVTLTLAFYRRNYIEGLFLSSGIIRSPDYTMEQIVGVARSLREEHGFRGYIHLKTIPDADPALLEEAGRHADRLSINIELPQAASLKALAPEKDGPGIRRAMARMRQRIDAAREAQRGEGRAAAPRFAPAGQSTQMIIGADAADDRTVLQTTTTLYASYGLRRVYYSAYSPIPDASRLLPPAPPPLVREHRLYQADWLLRFYGFEAEEVLAGGTDGMLDLGIDPKLAWALKHRERFPVDVNRAPREMLLRVPGLGARTVERLLSARRHRAIRSEDLARLRLPLGKLLPFLVTADHHPRGGVLDRADLRRLVAPRRGFGPSTQLALL
ncbi:putative DNA modification/repair radical SAM protein [Siccirubricoccus deserti]|uniref:DNA modification/repair radical SAM protein n=1 Tax=Siccirubricoccus deserti TaxID=2013562 RepID=A0A9X0QX09_9PROT|nr:putative DNA modification/repair radical SAM protein [Siccirubricoccus deserti]MBC4014463.1 putative DNA modification/repair radical SAM protein [Siccirubricoccus deserti]GGC32676.1 putative DNA modification/repair radical SAM protein [Siccirubricoccus deserti]